MGKGAVIIYKIHGNNEDDTIGYYEISSNDYEVNNFYMRIDKSNKIVKFFATKNFNENPIHIVDFNKNEKLGCIPEVPMSVFIGALKQAFRAFEMDTFPEHLHYMA